MCDGNRRPNYDGCLLPPQFIGPGDKYNIPETHRIHDFFKARDSPTGFKTGKGIWLDYRHGAVHAQPNGSREIPPESYGVHRAPGSKNYAAGRPKTQQGLFSAVYDNDPPRRSGEDAIGFRRSATAASGRRPGGGGRGDDGTHTPSRQGSRPTTRFKTFSEYRENVGRGPGGIFSTTGYLGPSKRQRVIRHEKPMYRGARRDLFDDNPNRPDGKAIPLKDKPCFDMKKYRPENLPATSKSYRDSRNWTNTFERHPLHRPNYYTDPAPHKGLRYGRSEFYTYQNKTRTAYAGAHGVCGVNGQSWSEKRMYDARQKTNSRSFNHTDSLKVARGLSRTSGRIAR